MKFQLHVCCILKTTPFFLISCCSARCGKNTNQTNKHTNNRQSVLLRYKLNNVRFISREIRLSGSV